MPIVAVPPLSPGVRLVLCASGLMITFLLYGVLQERLMAKPFPRADGETRKHFFCWSLLLVLVNRVLSSAVVATWMWWRNEQLRPRAPLRSFLVVAVLNSSSTFMQYEVPSSALV